MLFGPHLVKKHNRVPRTITAGLSPPLRARWLHAEHASKDARHPHRHRFMFMQHDSHLFHMLDLQFLAGLGRTLKAARNQANTKQNLLKAKQEPAASEAKGPKARKHSTPSHPALESLQAIKRGCMKLWSLHGK